MKGAIEEDDDDVVMVEEPVRNNNVNKDKIEEPETVTIDDGTKSDEECYIEKEQPGNKKPDLIMDKRKEESFVKLLKNNALLNKIVQRCLNMENNCGMSRVVHKTLLPLYKDVNNTLKQSDSLTEALETVLHRLKHDPNHKFLHIKTLCDGFKEGRFGRKVPFVTLATDLKKDSKKHTKIKTKKAEKSRYKNSRLVEKYCNKTDVIDLDNSDESDGPVTLDLSNDSDREDVMIVEEIHNNDDGEQSNKENRVIQINTENENNIKNSEKENSRFEDINDTERERNGDNKNEVTEAADGDVQKEHFIEIDTSNITNMSDLNPDCNLLMPHNSVSYKKFSSQYNKIIEIENKINDYNKIIQQLEEQEVTNNSHTSPYMLCDKYKANVVALYKKLCILTGNGDGNLMKQRVVRLHAVEGHPQGPVKVLEAFLNSTIDNTGAVPLPAFDDVATCVSKANSIYNLGWSTEQIMREAFALFTHCGHALRKQRQKREYKDLLSLVEDKDIDEYDPANNDPELQRRLEENMKIAKANEDEILERYVQLENLHKKPTYTFPPLESTSNLTLQPNTNIGSESDSDIESSPKNNSDITKLYFPILYVDKNLGKSSNLSHQVNTPTTSTQCTYTYNNIHNNDKNPQDTTITSQNSELTDTATVYTTLNVLQKVGTSNQYIVDYNSETQEIIQNEDNVTIKKEEIEEIPNTEKIKINFESEIDSQKEPCTEMPSQKEVQIKIENENDSQKEECNINILFEDDIKEGNKEQDESTSNNQNTVEVKKEPLDIQSLLSSFGDNYVSTIFDIEDPFVIVEISDSSDEDL